MIERDRKIIHGLQRIQERYVQICFVLSDRDNTTDDPIGAALDLDDLAKLRTVLQETSAAIARRLMDTAEVVDGQVIVGEAGPGGGH